METENSSPYSLLPILNQINPVNPTAFCSCEIHSNVIPPSMCKCSKWSLFLRFPHHKPDHISLPRTCLLHSPSSHLPRIGHLSNICLGVHIINLLNTQFPSTYSCLLLLRLNVLLRDFITAITDGEE